MDKWTDRRGMGGARRGGGRQHAMETELQWVSISSVFYSHRPITSQTQLDSHSHAGAFSSSISPNNSEV